MSKSDIFCLVLALAFMVAMFVGLVIAIRTSTDFAKRCAAAGGTVITSSYGTHCVKGVIQP